MDGEIYLARSIFPMLGLFIVLMGRFAVGQRSQVPRGLRDRDPAGSTRPGS